MATTKFDPYRKTGGTIELVRDSKTGAYSTKTVGFADLPVFNLPKLGIVEVTEDAATTKKKADEALKTQTSEAFQSASGGGGGGGEGPNEFLLPVDRDDGKRFSDAITKTAIENQEAQEEAAGIGIEPIKTSEIKAPEVFMGEFAGEGPDRGDEEKNVTDVTVKNYEDAILRGQVGVKFVEKDKFGDALFKFEPKGIETARGRKPVEGVRTSEREALGFETPFKQPETQTQTRSDLPAPKDRTLGISADPTTFGKGVATDTQAEQEAAALGIQAPGVAFARPRAGTIDQMAADAQAKKVKNISEVIKDFTDNNTSLKIARTGLMLSGQILNQVGDAILGVTAVDKRRRELDSAAAKSLGFKTRGELGASTDPGRIAMSPADHVLGGKNRDSALGNLSEAGAKRIQTRMTTGISRVEKRYGKNSKQAQDFREKTKTFQRQMNEFNTEKEKKRKEKAQNPNLRSGAGKEGGGTSGGKIVCTMMNELYGFGSFRNKIWLRQSKNLAPEYQKGYHRIFLPLVKYAKQKGITNKIIKNILEHIAIHRTIDIRQEERNKIHLIGRIYRKILEPICYWAGKK
jgi:hypothetical protein